MTLLKSPDNTYFIDTWALASPSTGYHVTRPVIPLHKDSFAISVYNTRVGDPKLILRGLTVLQIFKTSYK